MSHSSTHKRGQTEPIAALVAVSVIALALSLYGLVALGVLNQSTDRDVAEPTLNNVWEDIRSSGVYDGTGSLSDITGEDADVVLPEGYNVYVNITRLNNEGQIEVVDTQTILWQESDGQTDISPPEWAHEATRPIPIRVTPGEVRTGTLTVEVWST